MTLSILSMGRLAKEATGARVANPAKEELRLAAEEYVRRLSKDSWELARNAGRKTVKRQDVQLALRLR